jgi:phosphoribosylanthranilate isomerase
MVMTIQMPLQWLSLQWKYPARNMALSESVYVRNVDNLSDARYCAGMGVEMIGFVLDSSVPSSLDGAKFKEISEWIAGVRVVGEFGKMPAEEIAQFLTESAVDFLLVPDVGQLPEYKGLSKPLIVQINLDAQFDEQMAALSFSAAPIEKLLAISKSSSVESLHRAQLLGLSGAYELFLGFGIDGKNARSISAELGLSGLSLAGSAELRPGFKDFDELANVLEALEID